LAILKDSGNTSAESRARNRSCCWQPVEQSQRKAVVDYIDRQAEHHARWSFEQEFLTLLKKSDIAYDPRYVLG